jgi:hypothetical protein
VLVAVSAALIALVCAPGASAANCGLPVLQPACPQAAPSQPPPPAATDQLRGFSDPALNREEIGRDRFLWKIEEAGARVHRITLSWQNWETKEGQFDSSYLAAADRDYNDELGRGIRQLIVLEGTPYWALTPQGRGSSSPNGAWRCDNGYTSCYAPPNVRDEHIRAAWQNWVATVVRRYPQALGVEIWNEPNIRWNWFQDQDPALYGLMLQSAHGAAKAADPDMPVVSGSLSTYDGGSYSEYTNYKEFLRTVYQVAGKGSFDAVGWHGYPCNYNSEPYYTKPALHLANLRGIRQEFGDTGKPFWLTEMGATTGPKDTSNCSTTFSDTKQRYALAEVFDWAKREQAASHDLPVALVHSLFDWNPRTNTATGPVGGDFGVIAWHHDAVTGRAYLEPKTAYSLVTCKMRNTC